jgi:hypothetical protein
VASRDRPPASLDRVGRAAAHLVAKHALHAPVDIRAVARCYADLEIAAPPGDCDGVTVDVHGPRPRIIVRGDRGEPRLRFTVAHELAHILLYWHPGRTVACHVASTPSSDTRSSHIAEQEANRFAGDVLVPRIWLARLLLLLGDDHPEDVLREVARANVSAAVAGLSLLRALPPGQGFALLDARDRVEIEAWSPGTIELLPHLARSDLLGAPTLAVREIGFRGRRIVWRRALVTSSPQGRHDSADSAFGAILDALPQAESLLRQLRGGQLTQALDRARRDGLMTASHLLSSYRRTVSQRAPADLEVLEHPLLLRWLEGLAREHATDARGRRPMPTLGESAM